MTLYSVLNHILFLCKIQGIIIFKTNTNSFKSSARHALINIIQILLFLSFVIFSFTTLNTINIAISIHLIQQIFATILILSIWISSISSQRKHVQLLKNLQEVNKKFQILGIWIYFGKQKKIMYLQMLARSILIMLSLLGQTINAHPNLNFLFRVPLFVATILNSTQSQLVQVYIGSIRENFEIINEHLIHLEEYSSRGFRENWKSMCPFKSKLELLEILTPIHHNLCKIVRSVNDIFGISLLASFGLTFVLTIVDLYHLVSILNTLEGVNLIMSLTILSNCFPYIVETINICYMCNSAAEQANLAGAIIHQLSIKDKNVKKQMELFSLQLSHEDVEFNAGGFFSINYPLLFSIVGGVTTNLVILIQFSNSLESE